MGNPTLDLCEVEMALMVINAKKTICLMRRFSCWQLSWVAIVVGGSCPGGSCPGWQLSSGALVLDGSCLGGSCPGGCSPRTAVVICA